MGLQLKTFSFIVARDFASILPESQWPTVAGALLIVNFLLQILF